MKIPKPLQKMSGMSQTVVFGENYARGDKPYIQISPARQERQPGLLKPPKYTSVTPRLIEVEVLYEIDVNHVSEWYPLIFNDFIIRCEGGNNLRRECSFWQKTVKTSLGLKHTSRFTSQRSTVFYVRLRFRNDELRQNHLPIRLQPLVSFEYYNNRKSDFNRIALELPDIVLHEEPYILSKIK
jgi:hypothetical protein